MLEPFEADGRTPPRVQPPSSQNSFISSEFASEGMRRIRLCEKRHRIGVPMDTDLGSRRGYASHLRLDVH